MKNSLFALLWAITVLPASAQKTLPHSLQSQAGNLDAKVAKALKTSGFDLGSGLSVQGKPAAVDRSGALQLDSTKTFFGYDFVGTDDSIPLYRTIYQYPQALVQTQTDDQFENDAWAPLSRTTLFSDDQKRLVEVYAEAYDLDKGDYVPDSRVIVVPHGNSQDLLDSTFVYGMDTLGINWVLLFFTANTYDAQDRLVESVSSFDYFGQPLLFKDVHTYDANGDNTLIESFALFENLEVPSGKTELAYSNHLVTEELAFTSDGQGGFMAQSKITYAYTNFGKIAQLNNYEWSLDADDWAQTQGVAYGYDNAQRVSSKETVVYNQDGTEERNLSEYTYVEAENLALESNFYWSVDDYFLSDRKFYYYSGGTLADKEPGALPLTVSPNPTTGAARLNLGAASVVRIFNAQGDMVRSEAFQPNGVLQVGDLPSGVYYVAARSEKEQYVGKLVKE